MKRFRAALLEHLEGPDKILSFAAAASLVGGAERA